MAVVDYFLEIEGIKGESTDSKHKDHIDIESWSFSEVNAGDSAGRGGGGAGKVSMQDIHFVSKYSKASPMLFLSCATGEHLKKATLTCRKAGGKQEEYLKVILSDLLVSSYAAGGSAHGDSVLPVDQFSINFAKIEWNYSPQDASGKLGSPIKTGYDVKGNKKV
jgi:type VI secretion system secreted protein Hcp